MEKHRKDSVYERVQLDFGVNVFFNEVLLLLRVIVRKFKKEIKNRAWTGVYNIGEI